MKEENGHGKNGDVPRIPTHDRRRGTALTSSGDSVLDSEFGEKWGRTTNIPRFGTVPPVTTPGK
jgi:hypothetical protein